MTRFKVEFKKSLLSRKETHHYAVVIDNRPVGNLEYNPSYKNEASWYEFTDFHTKVTGSRGGLSMAETRNIIRRFYEVSHHSIGHIENLDSRFPYLLEQNGVPYRYMGDLYFFFDPIHLATAQLLV